MFLLHIVLAAYGIFSFFLYCCEVFYCKSSPHFIHSTVERHLASSSFLSVISNTVMNFLVNLITNFSLCILRSEMAVSWGVICLVSGDAAQQGFVSGLSIYAPVSSSSGSTSSQALAFYLVLNYCRQVLLKTFIELHK